ncbi:VaFE repeat-containing surface-anchored protein [Bilifractor sp. LCP19S3_H10]|uniref:VaFE repeat-containing surface-anchored protein n=1 Tax=Bilifractor sp. LCP19S3_H10 TaxID=3438736 RepID=UPI003F8E6534
MSSLKNRVMALALSVLTAVTTCAGTVPAWAETVQTENVASTSEKQTAETVVINVKIDNAGGSVAVGNDSDKKTVQMQDDGTVKTTDAEGNETVAAIDNTHPYALTLTETKGATVPVTAAASDGYEVSTYTVTMDGGSEDTGFVSGDTFSYNLTADQDKTIEVDFAKKDEAKAQTEVQAQTETTTPAAEDKQIDTSAYDDMDFTSARLLVGTDNASVVEGDQEYILSSYDGLYLIQYPDVRLAKVAYAGYAKTADFVDIDNATLSAADDADITDVTAASAMTQDSNPLTELANAPTDKVKKGTIALIDTGASQEGNVTEAVSMLGDDASDDNGHGSQMVQYITEEDPDAKILSIKALDANGNGTPSSVTAAIHYAMERKVSVINLSLSGTKTAESSAVEEAVKEAVNAGITVIGAAGNNGKNAKYYIPGEIAEAVIAGSVDREGKKLSSSNYGDTVDYYVVSASTSEAAARLSGIFSKEGKITADNKKVFKDVVSAKDSTAEDEDKTEESASGNLQAATIEGSWSNISYYDNRSSKKTLSDLYGISRKQFVDSLNSHKSKYLGVPYGPADYNLKTMNCGFFVGLALHDAGAKNAPIGANSYNYPNWATIIPYMNYFHDNGIHAELYATKAELLAAKPEKGDIIIMNPRKDVNMMPGTDQFGNLGDSHIGIYWGDTPGDDLFWHSIHGKDQYRSYAIHEADATWYKTHDNANAPGSQWKKTIDVPTIIGKGGNIISKLTPKSDSAYILYRWSSSKVYAKIHKSGSNGATTGAQYEIWYDGKGTAGGGKGTGKSFIIGKDGNSNVVDLEPGHTYYYHEFAAPSNGNYTLDDTWYKFTASQIASHTDANNPLVLQTSDTPYVYLRIHKTGTEAAGSTAGAEYEIWYDGKGGADGGKGTGLKFTIGNDEYSNVVKVEPGHTYYYHECGTPSNGSYLLDDTWYKVTADQIKDHTSNSNPLVVNTSDTPKTYVYLTKASSNTDVTHNNRCYSLKDGIFELANTKTGKTYTVTTDENGNTPTIQVEIGTYHVTEKTAPHGYLKNTDIPDIEVTEDNVKNNPYHIQVQDKPALDPSPILLHKRDAETGKETPQGAGSLAGAQYTVKYYDVQNGDEASLKDETPLRTWVLVTDAKGRTRLASKYKVAGDDFYMDDGLAGMPIGTILIQETKAPDGYRLNNKVYTIHFNPDENGNVQADVKKIDADNDAADEVKALESPQRGGLNFLKYDTSNKPMAGIPFVITSETTGESHVIIADANGRVNTEANKHSNNTNGNDSLIRKTAEGAYVCDDPSKLDANAGIWFGEAPADDSKMALLFDKYTISEVFVKNLNYGKNISNVRKNDTKENKAGSVLGVVIDTNGKNVSLDPEVWENPDVKLGTTAKNADIDSKNIALTDTATVVDTVSYENLTPGDAYILKGKLVDKDNPTVAVAEAQASFTPSQKDGTVNVTFHFSASNLEGKTLVAFEYLNWKGIEIAKHEETGDTSQTVYVPKLRTTLTDQSVEDEVGVKSKEDTFVDAVQYWNLAPHENFLIKGQLIQKSTGKVLATADSGEFSVGAKSMDGTKNVIFKFDSTGLAGETVVAYEKLYHVSDDGDLYELDQHENLEDTAQSVYFPKIGTTAKDGQTSDHVGTSGKSAKLVDTVKLNNVVVGKEYAVRGTLMNKQTGEPVLENGKKITAEGTVTFDASGKAKVTGSASNAQGVLNAKNSNHSVDGSVDLTFTFNSSVLEGQTVVAFEDLLHKNIEVDTHSDIKDEDQSVHYPKVGTSAKDGYTQDSVGTIGAKATVVDTVKLENLVPGMTYTVNGILKDQKTGADFTVNGKTVTQSADITVNADGTLTAKNKEKVTAVWNKDQNRVDGTVDLTFTFDSSAIAGTSVVAFESLQHNKVTVAAHSDIKDEGQTTHYPKIQTTATDQKTGDHVGTIFGEMINKVRAMLGDEDVSGDGIKDSREQTIVDHVKLENLALGKEYTVSGVLMDQSTGKAIEIDGKQVTQTAVITTSADGKITAKNGEKTSVTAYDAQNHRVDGYVDLTYKLDSSKLVKYGSESENGAAIVVFEDLIHNGVTVNVHHDISDAGQTVGDVGIHTTAVDSRTGDHVGDSPRKAETHSSVADEKETVITDTVNMTKLVQGAEYTVKGYLVVQDASSKDHPVYLKADGNTTSNKSEAISATKTFTADEKNMQNFTKQANSLANGSVALSFPVKSSLVSGKTIVVFEDLYHNNVKISTHSDISDENQSVHYPDVKTSAIDKNTKDDVGTVHKNAVIVDTVQLTNLVPGKSYTVNGTLHDQKSGDVFKDADGNAVTQKAEITVSADGKNITAKNGEKVTVTKTGTAVSGTVDLTFTFDSSLLAGKTLVAFEDLEHNGVKVATHSNIYDESQSEHYPKIQTTATDQKTGDHVGTIFGEMINKVRAMLGDEDVSGDGIKDSREQTIVDHVKLENLALGKEYTVSGVLMDQSTGKAIEIDGKQVTQTAVITTSADGKITAKNGEKTSVTAYDAQNHRVDGYVDLTYKLDSSKLVKYGSESENGAAIVVFEDLIHNGVTVNVHHDISDAGQTVGDVGIHTTAVDSRTGDHVGDSPRKAETHSSVADEKETVITDTVNMTKLVQGAEYTVKGYLVVQDASSKDHPVYLKADGNTTSNKSEAISAAKTFTADEKNMQNFTKQANGLANGSVALSFPVKSSLVSGKTIVVFEDLYHNNVKISTHSDISDENQSVHYPDVKTSAIDKDTKDDVGTVHKNAVIVDTVQLTNLVPGKNYTVNGTLHDQKSGDIFKDADGNAVTQKAEITVSADGKNITAKNGEKVTVTKTGTAVSGTVDLTFTFDSSLLAGKTLVAFEDLEHNGVKVATHSNIYDESQSEHYPKIQTTATDQKTGDHVGTIFGEMINKVRAMLGDEDVSGDGIKDSREQTIVDHVKLENLALGKEYTVSGVLMDQSTGKAIEIDGKQVTQTAVITTSADGKITAKNGEKTSVTAYDAQNHRVDGYVDLTYKLDSSKLVKYGSESENGAAIVVFEDLIHNGVTVNVHHDISDAGQTVGDVGIHTTAVDSRTGDHVGDSPRKAETHSSVADEKETVITDTVNMTKLVQGAEYTVKGYLVVQDASSKDHPVYLKADGNTTSNKSEAISATKTFTADEKNMQNFTKQANSLANGSVALSFPVKSSLVSGKTIVVFEDLYHNNVKISTHSDISDENQSVHYPDVKTSAIDKDTKDDVGTVHKNAVIVDTVQLTNLVPGKNYTVNGTLHDQKSGDIFKDADGNAVTQKAEITVSADGKNITAKNGEKVTVTKTGTAVSGTVDLTFTFDSSLLAGKTLVAFEDLEHNGVKVATHSNIYDESQSEHYPEIHTTAVDKTTGDHVGSIFGALINGLRKMFGQTDADGNGIADDRQQNIVDTVTLANLVPGKSYVVSGKLMDADTGKAVVIDGKEVTASTVITASENGISSSNGCKTVFDNFDSTNHDVDGSVDLTFTLDSSKIQGVETVVFERLYHADGYTSDTQTPDWEDETHLINRHEDTNDDGQSVSEVGIHTTAVDLATGNDQGVVPNSYVTSSVIEDTVELAKLVPGQAYQIRGRLVDLTDSDFENGKVVYLKSDGSATDNIDEAVTVTSDEFEAQASEETHKLQLTVSGSLVQGKDVTVFEDILHNGIVISSHPAKNTPETWDKEEFKSQTVHYMTGKTNATDGVENIHSTVADGTRTIEDKVYFQNLLVGKTYSVEGTLHDKATGEALTDEGATRKVTFTAAEDLAQAAYDNDETEQTAEPAKVSDLKVTEHFDGTKTISGYVTLTFTVDASELAGQTLVAFEKFTNEGKEIFVHEDLEDLPQTIKIPKIGTTAKAGELDETALYNEDGTPKEITITDTVSYENLWTKELLDKLHEEGLAITDNGIIVPSDHTPVYDINETGEYTMTGKLIDKATGKAITDVNGNEYESSVHFVPDAENGTVDVTFTLNAADFIDKDGNCTLDGKSIVVYEDLYQVPEGEETSENNHTAVHHDVDDQEQDIRFPKGRTHATDYTDGKLTQEELSALTQEDLAKIAADHESEVDIDSHEAEATDTMKILDMVSYSNLHAATEYTVTGALQTVTERDENGKAVKWEPALDDDGKEITQTVTFTTPEDEDGQDSVSGYVPVLFTFKGVSLAGKTTVAFEKFTREEQDVMVHHDINDTPQTDYIPSIHTNATSAVTGNHNGVVGKDYIIDEVSYENLEEGRTYSLHAQLMDKATGKAVDNVTIEGSFVAGTENQFISKDGTVISTMEDVRKQLTAETNGASHKALNGKAVEPVKENPSETPTEEEELTVSAAEVGNGIAKGTYVVTPNEWTEGKWGFVHVYDKDPADGGKLVLAADVNDQNPETAITLSDGQFLEYFNVSLKKNSKVEVPSYDGTQMQEIYDADMKALKDADIQTDKTVEETETKEADTDVTVDLPEDPEKETAADEAVTNSSVEDGKDAVTAASETEETAKAADQTPADAETGVSRVSGSVYVIIPVDASKLGGHTLVAFEKLYTNPENGTPKEIAHHEDINDEAQSVHYIEIQTTATDKKDGDKTLATSGTVTVNDKVSFKNLIPGKKYKVSGTLMDKKTGEALVVNGKKVTSENTFTPNAANGSINMEFTFDVTSVASGDYVVFEKLYDAESKAEIAKHEDINDKSQTVTVPTRPEIQTSDRPMSPVLPIAAGVAVVAILAAVLLGRKKKTDEK